MPSPAPVSAPKWARNHLARGVSPEKPDANHFAPPSAAPPRRNCPGGGAAGGRCCLRSHNSGLTPRAIRFHPFGVAEPMLLPNLIGHRFRLRQQHADKLPAVVRGRPGEERAGPHSQSRPEPDMIDVINGQPRRKTSHASRPRTGLRVCSHVLSADRIRCCGWVC